MISHLVALPAGTRLGVWQANPNEEIPNEWNTELVVALLYVRDDEDPWGVCYAINLDGDEAVIGFSHAYRDEERGVMTPVFGRIVPPGDEFPSADDYIRAEGMTEYWHAMLRGEDPDAPRPPDHPRYLRGLN